MFQQGDRVLYASHDVCTIVGIEEKKFGKTKRRYYCLLPMDKKESMFYVPADNPAAVAKLSPLMSRDALLELLHSDIVRKDTWIVDDGQRKLRYRELLSNGDRAAILSMIHSVLRHKESQAVKGKRLHQCDENFLQDAHRLLVTEFCVVFDLDPASVHAFLQKEFAFDCT